MNRVYVQTNDADSATRSSPSTAPATGGSSRSAATRPAAAGRACRTCPRRARRPQRRRRLAAGHERGQRRADAVRGRGRRARARRQIASGGSNSDERRRPRTSSSTCSTTAHAEHHRVPLDGGGLAPIDGSTRPLSAGKPTPRRSRSARTAKTLVVTERGTNAISTYTVDERRPRRRAVDDPVLGRDAVRVRLRERLGRS